MSHPKISTLLNNSIIHAITPDIKEQILKFGQNSAYDNHHKDEYECLKSMFTHYYKLEEDLSWYRFADILSNYNDFETQLVLGPVLREFMIEMGMKDGAVINPATGGYLNTVTPEILSQCAAEPLGFTVEGIKPLNASNPIASIRLFNNTNPAAWQRTEDHSLIVDYEKHPSTQFSNIVALLDHPATNDLAIKSIKRHVKLTGKLLAQGFKEELIRELAGINLTSNQIQYFISNYNTQAPTLTTEERKAITDAIKKESGTIKKIAVDFINSYNTIADTALPKIDLIKQEDEIAPISKRWTKIHQTRATAEKVLNDTLEKIKNTVLVFTADEDIESSDEIDADFNLMISNIEDQIDVTKHPDLEQALKILGKDVLTQAVNKKKGEIKTEAEGLKALVSNRSPDSEISWQQEIQKSREIIKDILDTIDHFTIDTTKLMNAKGAAEFLTGLLALNHDPDLESALKILGEDEANSTRKIVADAINNRTKELTVLMNKVLENHQQKTDKATKAGKPIDAGITPIAEEKTTPLNTAKVGDTNHVETASKISKEKPSKNFTPSRGEGSTSLDSDSAKDPNKLSGDNVASDNSAQVNSSPTFKIHQEYNEMLKLLYKKAEEFDKDRPKTDEIKLAYDTVIQLHKDLLIAGNAFFTPANLKTDELIKFQNQTHKLIEDAIDKGKLDKHRAVWKPILIHILAFIGTGGVGYIAAILIDYAVNKRSTFFATNTANIAENIKQKVNQIDIEDQTPAETPITKTM